MLTSGQEEILLATREGLAIRFSEADVRGMGRSAYGVKGIELEESDQVVGMQVVGGKGTLLTITEHGYGKRTLLEEYRVQTRGGKGLIDIKTSPRNGQVVGVELLRADEGVMLITEKGMIIRLNTEDISTIGRNTQGVTLIQLDEGDHLVGIARLAERVDVDEDEGGPTPQEPS
jgi:DNA gyrase subunit A